MTMHEQAPFILKATREQLIRMIELQGLRIEVEEQIGEISEGIDLAQLRNFLAGSWDPDTLEGGEQFLRELGIWKDEGQFRIEYLGIDKKWIVYDGKLVYTKACSLKEAKQELAELKGIVGKSYEVYNQAGEFVHNYDWSALVELVQGGDLDIGSTIRVVAD